MSQHLDFHTAAVRLRPEDDVAVAKRTLKAGTVLDTATGGIALRQTIPAGHKIAMHPLSDGGPMRKYGQIIGFARGAIEAGDHVHSHNLEMRDFDRAYEFGSDVRPLPPCPPDELRYFQGYARPGGRVGTRNYVAILSSVNCSASVSRYVLDRFRAADVQREFPNVDGVVAFTHKGGCSINTGEPLKLLQRVFAGMARHPNIAGYVMIGLGCEVNQISQLKEEYGLADLREGEHAPVFMNIQALGGTRKTVDAATAAVAKLLPLANTARRTRQPAARIVLAENCGGSDGNSGITANPALGFASDELVRQGGTSVLAETTEIYGAEHLLTRRAVSREVGEKLVRIIRWWEHHVRIHGMTIDNNPSPGNKDGGLTTIYEKSLGAAAKGGSAPLSAVYEYAEPVTAQGLCFMDTPGNDAVSMTGLVAGGCNVGVFTTGRGSVYGCKPMPCIKVATHTPLYQWMEEDMDLNAGTILEGTETVEQVGRRILEKIIAVAGGEKTKSELAGMGDEEFAPWSIGPVF